MSGSLSPSEVWGRRASPSEGALRRPAEVSFSPGKTSSRKGISVCENLPLCLGTGGRGSPRDPSPWPGRAGPGRGWHLQGQLACGPPRSWSLPGPRLPHALLPVVLSGTWSLSRSSRPPLRGTHFPRVFPCPLGDTWSPSVFLLLVCLCWQRPRHGI